MYTFQTNDIISENLFKVIWDFQCSAGYKIQIYEINNFNYKKNE
jgi:hypothetical protein